MIGLTGRGIAAATFLWGAARVEAQVDYRNLDDHRPSVIEDAYPIERHAFELSVPYRMTVGDGVRGSIEPEVMWGLVRNGAVGLRVEWDAHRPSGSGAGPRLFMGVSWLQNLTADSPTFPAIAIRLDLGHPLDGGNLGSTTAMITGLATRSWGVTRLHANLAWSPAAPAGELSELPRWRAGLAIDRTLFRSSTLIVADLVTERPVDGDRNLTDLGLGFRRQIGATLVLHSGLRWIVAPDQRIGFELGLSHAFAIAGLMGGERGTR